MNDHHDDGFIQSNEDGSLGILVDRQDLQDALRSLQSNDIHVISQEEVIWDADNKVCYYLLTLRAKPDDIRFALDAASKFTRPFPPWFSRRKQ